MHPVTVKYADHCRLCGVDLPIGSDAEYERHVGCFCPNCAQEHKALEELTTAERMERKAEGLRQVRVAGDAETDLAFLGKM